MSPPHREPIVIACAADDRYVQPLTVMLQSLLTNLSSDRTIAVYIIDGGIEPAHKQALAKSCHRPRAAVHWLSAEGSSFSGLPLWGRMPVAPYYKLLVPRLVPASVHKVIWLDSDLVVVGDLAKLWDTDPTGHHVLAVQDWAVPFVSSRFGVADYEQLGLASNAKYFNSGVMVVDLDLWRRDDVSGRVVAYLRDHRDAVFFWDQEGLNVALADQWGELDPRWNHNVSVGVRSWRRVWDQDKPWIIHFAGNLKPWVYQGSHPSHAVYFQYLDMTAWVGWRPKRSMPFMIMRVYESSGLRSVLYPAEQWGMQLLRTFTRRNAP
jgi:lipopolysaccharide biosynthesis glycosyltransferase